MEGVAKIPSAISNQSVTSGRSIAKSAGGAKSTGGVGQLGLSKGGAGAIGSLKSNNSLSFSQLVQQLKTQKGETVRGVKVNAEAGIGDGLPNVSRDYLNNLSSTWQQADRTLSGMLPKLSAENRDYISAQQFVNRLHMQTELLTRAAEGFSSSIKRIQQMGNG